MRASVPPTPGGHHAPTALPIRPLRRRVGHPQTVALVGRKARPSAQVAAVRHVADAVFYLLRSGCSWRMLPKEYPPWQTVYYHLRKWRIDGRLYRAHDRLREAVRQAEGRDRDPSAAVTDSQEVVKTTPVGGPERGYDGAKRISGRKRHLLLVDTGGLLLSARVHGADLPYRDGGWRLLRDGLVLPSKMQRWG